MVGSRHTAEMFVVFLQLVEFVGIATCMAVWSQLDGVGGGLIIYLCMFWPRSQACFGPENEAMYVPTVSLYFYSAVYVYCCMLAYNQVFNYQYQW